MGGLLARGFGLSAPFWFAAVAVSATALLAWPILNDRNVATARERASVL